LKKGHGSFLGIPVVAGDQGIRGGPIPYHPLLYLFAALVVPCRDNIDLPITSHRPPEIGILVEYSRLQRIAVHILHPACPVCYRRGDDLITERSSGYIGFAMVIDTNLADIVAAGHQGHVRIVYKYIEVRVFGALVGGFARIDAPERVGSVPPDIGSGDIHKGYHFFLHQ